MKNKSILLLLSIAFVVSCGTNEYSAVEDMRGKYKSFSTYSRTSIVNDYKADLKIVDSTYYENGDRFITAESESEYLIEPGFYKHEGFLATEDPYQYVKQFSCGDEELKTVKTTYSGHENVETYAFKLQEPKICRFKIIIKSESAENDNKLNRYVGNFIKSK